MASYLSPVGQQRLLFWRLASYEALRLGLSEDLLWRIPTSQGPDVSKRTLLRYCPLSPCIYEKKDEFPQTHVCYFSGIRFYTLVLQLTLLLTVLCYEHGSNIRDIRIAESISLLVTVSSDFSLGSRRQQHLELQEEMLSLDHRGEQQSSLRVQCGLDTVRTALCLILSWPLGQSQNGSASDFLCRCNFNILYVKPSNIPWNVLFCFVSAQKLFISSRFNSSLIINQRESLIHDNGVVLILIQNVF